VNISLALRGTTALACLVSALLAHWRDSLKALE
jgi:hypothetical protein